MGHPVLGNQLWLPLLTCTVVFPHKTQFVNKTQAYHPEWSEPLNEDQPYWVGWWGSRDKHLGTPWSWQKIIWRIQWFPTWLCLTGDVSLIWNITRLISIESQPKKIVLLLLLYCGCCSFCCCLCCCCCLLLLSFFSFFLFLVLVVNVYWSHLINLD